MDEFIQKAIANKHVHELSFKQPNYNRYHLFSRIVYRAIDKEHSANRKAGTDAKAILKLKILDFVLDNLDEDYLEEEEDKVRFFTVTKGLSPLLLPARTYESKDGSDDTTTRYFVDKFPIFFANVEGSRKPLLTFTYFPDDLQRSSGFAQHLRWYKPFLKALDEPFRFLYVANDNAHFYRAERQFAAILPEPDGQTYFPSMLTYFRLKQLWDAQKYAQFADKDYVALNRGEKKFSKPEHERLYQQWLKGDLTSNNQPAFEVQARPEGNGIFETYWLRT